MIYQLRVNLFFETTDPIDDILDKILDYWSETKVINSNSPNMEYSVYEIIENHHDDNPNGPCNQIDYKDNQLLPPD